MRVIAGRLKGRTFDSPQTRQTHPMSEKLRGALFNALGDVSDLTLLDAYSGTGAIAMEACSRGVRKVVSVEQDRTAQKVILENISKLGLSDDIELNMTTVKSWSRQNQPSVFDLVVCDPPHTDIRRDHLQLIADHAKVGGVVVFCLPPEASAELDPAKFDLLSTSNHGDAHLDFYRKTG